MKKILASLSVAFLPAFLFAATGSGNFSSLYSTLDSISGFINRLIPFVIGVAVLVFIIGLIQFVTSGGDEDKRKAARDTIIWGIIIIFVMTSVWGLVNILGSTFSLQNAAPSDYPQVP